MGRGFRVKSRGDGDLKTRYRPRRLDEIVPTFPLNSAKQFLSDKNASRVFLFEGNSGAGKTSLARIIARAIVCSSQDDKPCLSCDACINLETCGDFYEVNSANHRGIDELRSLVDGMSYFPVYLSHKIYILDEVHQITPQAQELLLKALEEPPQHVIIFLCTTQRDGLKRTLLSRTTPIVFKRLTRDQSDRVIDQVIEDHNVSITDDVKSDLFNRADGSIRELLNELQLYLNGDYEVGATLEEESRGDVAEIANALINKNWLKVASILESQSVKKSPESFRIGVTNYLRATCLKKRSVDAAKAEAFALGQLAGTLSKEAGEVPIEQYNVLVLKCLRACYDKK